jgi:tRNA threonylcarbamoyladenosine biosynthesis protein TsaE
MINEWIRFELKTLEHTELLGEMIVTCAKEGSIICLDGDLGAGKTTLAKAIGKHLNISEPITSPTFSIVKTYDGDLPFHHMDAYRLEGVEEAYEIDIDQYIYSKGLFVLEWARVLKELLPENKVYLIIHVEPATGIRQIELSGKGDVFDCLIKELGRYDYFRN